jgi:cobalt-precorrin-7 (C5)-methyltransferase
LAKINIIGIGPGSPDYITPAARKAVAQSDVVIGAQRSLNLFGPEITGETLVLTAKNLYEVLKHAAEAVKSGMDVALLSTGDPGFSGLLHTVLKTGLVSTAEITVVPGVSSIQACAARLAISWDTACLFTFHEGNVSAEEKNQLAVCLKNGKDVLLLPDSRAFAPKEIAVFLIQAGLNKTTPVYICENLTLNNENITSSTLEKISDQSFVPLCVMVIKANFQVTQ